jgi:hypothetical protein
MKAYERAATLQLTPEEAKALQADFPDEAFQPGAAGKDHLLYIEHAYLRDRLTQVLGLGQWAIIPRNRWGEDFTYEKFDKYTKQTTTESATRIYVEAMLVVRGAFVGEAVGAMEYYPKNQSQNYGDAVEGAKTAAFRRCCKELSIGLQAWKKDWCEGWWQRKRQNAPRNAAPSPASSRPPTNAPGGHSGNPVATPATSQTPIKAFPTKDSLTKALITLQAAPNMDGRNLVHEYFVKAGALLPTEALEDLPLRFCPNTPGLLRAVGAAIANFEAGEEALLGFPPHPEPEPVKEAPKAKPVEMPRDEVKPVVSANGQWFMPVIVPVPRKGMRRDEYLKSPDTIGSLFEARHDDTVDGQEARQRLWGFVNNYEPKGWTKRNGEQMPPSDGDKQFRLALDAFQDWFETTHPGEKL